MDDPAGEAAEGGPRLDQATLTGNERENPWLVGVWDRAGEASICWNEGAAQHSEPQNVPFDGSMDPERSNREAARRAKTTARRYIVSHGLTRQMSLTYSDDHLPDSLEEAWEDAEDFRRKIRERYGDMPMFMVPEWGSKTERFHWHALVPRYIPNWELRKIWGRGWIDIRKIEASKRSGGGKRANARAAAHYAAKYLAKTFEDGQIGTSQTTGRRKFKKRYSTSKGTKVVPSRQRFKTREEALAFVAGQAGGFSNLTGWWSSSTMSDWEGPPVDLAYWDSGGPIG